MTDSTKKPHLVLVKPGTTQNHSKPLPVKLSEFRVLSPSRKMDYLLSDPAGRELVRAIPPAELYWLVQEIGLGDALPVVEMASPEQVQIFLDMELWDKWEFRHDKAIEWMMALLECGESAMVHLFPQLDPEVLVLFLKDEIRVGGGVGDIIGDDDRSVEWDHSFDEMFMIKFLQNDHAQIIGTFLDVVYRNNHSLYVFLMESVMNELSAELEELAFQFRSGRLADLGFPSIEEAVEMYAPLDPSTFAAGEVKERAVTELPQVPVLFAEDGSSLLRRILPRASAQVRMEVNSLVNSAMVLEKWQESGNVRNVFDRVHGWLNIALEHLSGGDDAQAGEILESEYLKRLFRLGGGIIRQVVRAADGLTGGSPAAQQLLAGLRAKIPVFYRGLDPAGGDTYREFSSLDDVQVVQQFLSKLKS